MPFTSTKQQAWAHTPAGTKALGGAEKVHEWDEATKRQPGGFAALPKRAASQRALEHIADHHGKR